MLNFLCEEAGRLEAQLAARLDMDRLNNLPSEESRRPLSASRGQDAGTIN